MLCVLEFLGILVEIREHDHVTVITLVPVLIGIAPGTEAQN